MKLGRGALLGSVLAITCLAAQSCYRAEIDITLLIEQGAATGGEAGAPGPPTSELGGMGGDDSTSSGGAAGEGDAPPEGECDPAQVEAEQEVCRLRVPTRAECAEQDVSAWDGCYSGGCVVCTKSVREYPYYFDWHPCCTANSTCNSSIPVKCNARCPTPTEHDKVAPCWLVGRTP